MGFIVGTVESCVEAAKRGEIIAILPGGTGEAMFSRNYELLWGKRRGFAKIAVQAQVVSSETPAVHSHIRSKRGQF